MVGLLPVSVTLLPSEFRESGVDTGVLDTDKCCEWKWTGRYEFCSSVSECTGARCNGADVTVPNALFTDDIGPILSCKIKIKY